MMQNRLSSNLFMKIRVMSNAAERRFDSRDVLQKKLNISRCLTPVNRDSESHAVGVFRGCPERCRLVCFHDKNLKFNRKIGDAFSKSVFRFLTNKKQRSGGAFPGIRKIKPLFSKYFLTSNKS